MTSGRTWLLATAVGATVLLAWFGGRGGAGFALYGGLAAPVLVPAAWAAARLAISPAPPLLYAAGFAGVAALWLGGSWPQGLTVAGFVLGGLAGAWAWRLGWGAWRVLAVCLACLAPGFFFALGGVSLPEAFAEMGEELRAQYVAALPSDMPEGERAAALAGFDETLAGSLQLQRRLWPSLVALGLAVQAVLYLGLGWGLARLAGVAVPSPVRTPFARWRAPFASVWLLIGGLGWSLIGPRQSGDLGWNLVLVASLVLAVQGVAVQAWLVQRLLPPAGRIVFWVAGAVFLAPVLLASGGLVGLADQWWDLRRLRRPPDAGPS